MSGIRKSLRVKKDTELEELKGGRCCRLQGLNGDEAAELNRNSSCKLRMLLLS